MEPVKLEMLFDDKTAAGFKSVGDKLDATADKAVKAEAILKQKIEGQQQLIKKIEADIANIEKAYDRATPGMAKMEMGQELGAAKRALEEEKDALILLDGQVEKTAEKHDMLRTQVMKAKDELARLEMAGKRGTAEWDIATGKLGELNDQMKDTNQIAGIFADDEKKFKAVASGVSGIAGAMSAAVGVASLFGAEQEELARIQTRLQSVMAITIGLQQVAEALNKDSYFNVVLLTKAKTMLAAANLKVAATFGISTAAAKMFMTAISLGLTAAITGIIILFEKLKSKEKEQEKAMRDRLDTQVKLQKEIAEGYAAEVSKVEAARAALSSENVTREQKLKIINKLKEQIPGYVAELDGEGRLIRENTSAYNDYLAALEKSLLLRAAEKDLEQLLAKKYQLQKMKPEKQGNNLSSGLYKPKNAQEQLTENIEPAIDASIAEIDKGIDRIKNYISTNSLVELVKPKGSGGGSSSGSNTKAQAEYNAQKALMDQLAELRKQNAALEIDQMQDGLEKKLRQIDADGQAEIGKVAENRQKILDVYNKTYKTDIKDISLIPGIKPETLKSISDEEVKITQTTEAKKKQATADAQSEITALALSYADERTRIEAQYEEDILKLKNNGQAAAAANAEAERDKRISDVTAEMITNTELYRTATDEKLELSAQATAKLIDDIKKRIAAEVAAGKLSNEKAKELLGDLDKTGVSSKENKNKNNPFAQLSGGIKDYKKAQKDLTTARGNGAPAEELSKLDAASKKSLKSTAAAAGAALQGTQQILGSVVDGLDSLGMLTEEQKKTADDVIGMVGGAANIAMGIASGNPVQIIQGSIDLVVNAIKLFDKKSRDIEKAQKKHLQNVSDLERAYTKLQRAVDKALGTDVYVAQKALIENNKKQIAEYEAWIAEERKKKKKKQDEEAIKDKQDKIQELKNGIADEVQAITESLAQTNAVDFASQLADSLVSAFQNGEDAAVAMGDVINDVLRNAVVNSLKLQFLQKPLDEAVKYLGTAMNDGTLTEAEKKVFGSMVNAAGDNFNAALKAYEDLIGKDTTSSGRSSVAKGIAQASQDSVDENNGRLTNIAMILSNMEVNQANLGVLIFRIFDPINRIASNTDRLEKIETDMSGVKEGIEKINRDGINIKR